MVKGAILHPEELDGLWIRRARQAGLDVLGLHPVGGENAAQSLQKLLDALDTPGFSALLEEAKAAGLGVEVEAHAMGWLLPRALFGAHPDWFRMNEKGERTADFNLCPSHPEALEFVARRAATLARALPVTTGRYTLWLDDLADGRCLCPACRGLSASDQQLTVVNAMARALGEAVPGAKLAYLAYCGTLPAPERVKPEPNVFLEFAPFHRRLDLPLSHPENAGEIAALPALLKVFGREDARALDYWLDNSMASGWKKPPREFSYDPAVVAADARLYRQLGFSTLTCFACYLGEDYRRLHGELDIFPYGRALEC